MRFKTYLSTYLLFLLILLACFGIVSAYLINTQIKLHIEKSTVEYQSIATSFSKDIAFLHEQSGRFSEDIEMLVESYTRYYQNNNITIELVTSPSAIPAASEISFTERDQAQFVSVTGPLPRPYQNYSLHYYFDITKNIADMRRVQTILLFILIAFSIITALALYYILSRIFQPLEIVSNSSKKIAGGQYSERIYIKGTHELSAMADDFNQMAETIETQIHVLEAEAAGKQRFIDNFVHEIRTPLTSIYGYAEYMQKALLDEGEMIELAQRIMDSTSHMKNISSSLLELATLRQYQPILSKLPLRRLFESIAQPIQKEAAAQHVTFLWDSFDGSLLGQADLMQSLILNLCYNALKACTADKGVVQLGARKQGNTIVLTVTDNGCGIPEESIPKLTEPFYRTDTARNRAHGGAGLGLALCKQIVDVHGAQMTIQSAVGTGTTVTVSFTSS